MCQRGRQCYHCALSICHLNAYMWLWMLGVCVCVCHTIWSFWPKIKWQTQWSMAQTSKIVTIIHNHGTHKHSLSLSMCVCVCHSIKITGEFSTWRFMAYGNRTKTDFHRSLAETNFQKPQRNLKWLSYNYFQLFASIDGNESRQCFKTISTAQPTFVRFIWFSVLWSADHWFAYKLTKSDFLDSYFSKNRELYAWTIVLKSIIYTGWLDKGSHRCFRGK